ncbi:MAG: hypothetical protein ACRDJL_05105 [Actinomycetota bacterium]
MAAPDLERARAAKDKLVGLIGDRPAVNGVGLAPFGDGFCIKINLAQPSDEELPQEFEGVPVRIEVVGRITKRDSA